MDVRVGVVGVGHFGRFHAIKLAARGCLSGVHDPDPARAVAVAAELGVRACGAAELVAASDAIVVAAPTRFHHVHAMKVLSVGRHLFVEKPIAATLAEAEEIAAAARARGAVLQVGHIERYSAAVRTLRASGAGRGALTYEATRVAPFRRRGLDVSVVLDLMIHDLDLVLSMVGAPLVTVAARGGRIASERPDWAVAQLGFANGATATVTASRVSIGPERRLRMLGPAGETRLDFLARTLDVLRRGGAEAVHPMLGWGVDRATWTEHDSLEAEHAAFLESITEGAPVEADATCAVRALEAALRIEHAIVDAGQDGAERRPDPSR